VLVDGDGAVIEHGTPLVDDPARVGPTTKLGVDETSWLKAIRAHRRLYATGLVDLDAGIVIDMIQGHASWDLRSWLERQDPRWLAGITTVTTDLAESYRATDTAASTNYRLRVSSTPAESPGPNAPPRIRTGRPYSHA
jgi:hypothetical protein